MIIMKWFSAITSNKAQTPNKLVKDDTTRDQQHLHLKLRSVRLWEHAVVYPIAVVGFFICSIQFYGEILIFMYSTDMLSCCIIYSWL